MSEVNYEKMIEICKKFVYSNPLDFYQLFDIDRNMNLMEINKDIKNKKIRAMFHPDHVESVDIPPEYSDIYKVIVNSIPDLVNAFSTKENRKKYDQDLEIAKKKQERNSDDSETIIISRDDIKTFDQVLIKNSIKYDWEHVINAIATLMNNNDPTGFTREENGRNFIRELGVAKVRDIVFPSSYKDLNNNVQLDSRQIAMNYISDLFQKNDYLKNQANTVKKAIAATVTRYDVVQAKEAIKKYANEYNPCGITSNMNARGELRAYVNPKDVAFIIKAINNQDRFLSPSNYYFNTERQSTDYNIDLFIKNSEERYKEPEEKKY